MPEEFLTTEEMAKGLEALAESIEETFGGNDQSRICRLSAARLREHVRTIDRLRGER